MTCNDLVDVFVYIFNVWVLSLECKLQAVLFMVVSPGMRTFDTCLNILYLIANFWKDD